MSIIYNGDRALVLLPNGMWFRAIAGPPSFTLDRRRAIDGRVLRGEWSAQEFEVHADDWPRFQGCDVFGAVVISAEEDRRLTEFWMTGR